ELPTLANRAVVLIAELDDEPILALLQHHHVDDADRWHAVRPDALVHVGRETASVQDHGQPWCDVPKHEWSLAALAWPGSRIRWSRSIRDAYQTARARRAVSPSALAVLRLVGSLPCAARTGGTCTLRTLALRTLALRTLALRTLALCTLALRTLAFRTLA